MGPKGLQPSISRRYFLSVSSLWPQCPLSVATHRSSQEQILRQKVPGSWSPSVVASTGSLPLQYSPDQTRQLRQKYPSSESRYLMHLLSWPNCREKPLHLLHLCLGISRCNSRRFHHRDQRKVCWESSAHSASEGLPAGVLLVRYTVSVYLQNQPC